MASKKNTPKIHVETAEKESASPLEPNVVDADKVVAANKEQVLLQALQAENKKLREQASRALADYQNLERRQRADQAKSIDYAKETIFADLLQPLEHLSLAAASLKDAGLDMVVKQFWEALAGLGLTKIEPLGQPFDANTMEAIAKVGDGDTVKEVVALGFALGDRVLKPAKVKVG